MKKQRAHVVFACVLSAKYQNWGPDNEEVYGQMDVASYVTPDSSGFCWACEACNFCAACVACGPTPALSSLAALSSNAAGAQVV